MKFCKSSLRVIRSAVNVKEGLTKESIAKAMALVCKMGMCLEKKLVNSKSSTMKQFSFFLYNGLLYRKVPILRK